MGVSDMKQLVRSEESRLTNLYELSRIITSSTMEPKKILNTIIEAVVRISGATSGSLRLIDKESNMLKLEVACGFDKAIGVNELRIGEGITGWVARTGEPLLIPDVTKDERYVNVDADIKSELAVPLVIEGEVIGVANVNSTELNAFTTEDLESLTTLASHSAMIIQNSKLYDALNRRMNELSALADISKIIIGTMNLEEILAEIIERTAYIMKTKICSLMLLNEDGTELVIRVVYGGSPAYIGKPNLKVDESLIGRVVETRRPLTALDVRQVPGYRYPELAKKEGLCSLLSVPLMVKDRIIGVINVYKSTQHEFNQGEIQLLSSFADQSAIAIENARLYERMMALEEEIRQIEKLGMMGELGVEVAHEIRNPLTIIKMLLHPLKESNAKDVEIIEGEIDRINRIITQFLDYARPKDSEPQYIDINRVLNNALSLVEHRLSRRKIALEKDISPLSLINADPDKMGQVFLNLFLNSIDAMSAGGSLRISTRENSNSVSIEISDNGSGVPPEIKGKIFEPFITTKSGGLGLGLSVVHRIIEQHKGEIKVASEPEVGTSFTIILPIERGDNEKDINS